MDKAASITRIFAEDVGALGRYLALPDVEQILNRLLPRPESWSLEPELLAILIAWVIKEKPRTVVEIGTYHARTAIDLAMALQNDGASKVYTIDDDSSGQFDVARSNVAESGVADRIVLINRTSMEAFCCWGRSQIDLLILDGSHDYISVCTDFSLWARLLRKDGLIVVHDTVSRLERRFPDDYIFPSACFEIIEISQIVDRPSGHEWEGAALIRWRSDLHAGSICGHVNFVKLGKNGTSDR